MTLEQKRQHAALYRQRLAADPERREKHLAKARAYRRTRYHEVIKPDPARLAVHREQARTAASRGRQRAKQARVVALLAHTEYPHVR